MTAIDHQLPHPRDLRDDMVILDHRHDCPSPKAGIFRGHRGDVMLRCTNCGKARQLEDWMLVSPADLMQQPPESQHQPDTAWHVGSAFSTSFRCREHPDCPVSWRGRGCSRCAARSNRKTPKTTPEGAEYR